MIFTEPIDSIHADSIATTAYLRQLYNEARKRLGLPPKQFPTQQENHHTS